MICLQAAAELIEAVYSDSRFPIGGSWNKDFIKKWEACPAVWGITDHTGVLNALIMGQQALDGVDIHFFAAHPKIWGENRSRNCWAIWEQTVRPERVWLEVHENNRPAVDFYNSQGLDIIGKRPNYFGIGENALRMAKFSESLAQPPDIC